MKYTPGLWEVGVGVPNPGGPISRTIEYIAVRAPNGLVIALCGDANDPEMRTASENDALLISKAPAMYEALRRMKTRILANYDDTLRLERGILCPGENEFDLLALISSALGEKWNTDHENA